MSDTIVIGSKKTIRECGLDEYWLQDQIIADPSRLDLGDLEFVSREKRQSNGGRLDILLKDPEDDSMYEVEVMLGETDESHIIRTIEYWDNEKRRWPQRQHSAVLIAEVITRRFFNIIQMLSHAIPIIAVQANMIDANGQKILHFSKVLDTYEEPEEPGGEVIEEINEEYWRNESPWALEAAYALKKALENIFPNLIMHFVKEYIAININKSNYLRLRKRSEPKSRLSFRLNDDTCLTQAIRQLDEAGISYNKKNQSLRFITDKKMIETHAKIFEQIGALVKQSMET
jgi:hypothetical protein